MATPDGRLARANKATPLHKASPNGKVQPDQNTGTVKPIDESWVWEAYGVESLDELKQKYGVEELQGVSAEEAARIWEDVQVNGTISLRVVKSELGLD